MPLTSNPDSDVPSSATIQSSNERATTLILGKITVGYPMSPGPGSPLLLDGWGDDGTISPALIDVPVCQQKHIAVLRGDPTRPVPSTVAPTASIAPAVANEVPSFEFASALSPKAVAHASFESETSSWTDEISRTSSWSINKSPRQLPLSPLGALSDDENPREGVFLPSVDG